MTINSGAVLAHYKIVSLLGRGGMGEVYKAMDSRLSRLVALKVLPHSVVEDENRVRRFIQEAKAASALNHPHILTIHEIGEAQLQQQSIGDSAVDSDGLAPTATAGVLNYIAMELIEGETLRERIRRDRTDLKSLLRLLIQVAEGLAKAHGAGIVHRDLKPDNIMISADGYAKILDFGLAKLIEPEKAQTSGEPSDHPTVMIGPQSRSGIILGTVGYMSPEQAQGKPVDQRSDIFSFGCILYQAATGHMPFEADSLIDSLHKVIHSTAPPITDLNPGAPPDLQRIIRRCLAKDMEERCQMIKDVAIELKELLRDLESQHGLEHSAPPSLRAGAFSAPTHDSVEHDTVAVNLETSTSKPALSAANMARNKITWIAAVVATLVLGIGALLVGAFIAYSYIWRVPSEPKMAISAPVMKMARLTSGGKASQATISPDGRYVVLVSIEDGKQSLRVRQVNTTSDVQIVPAGDVRYTGLTFSPDGDFIYFVVSEKNGPVASLYYVPVLGGTARRLVTDVDSAVTFSPDGKRLAFVRTAADQGEQQLIIVNADGSGEQKVATRKMPNFFRSLSWAPDGKSFACAVGSFVPNYNSYVVEIPTEGGNEKPIGSHNWLSIGQLAWLQDRGGLIVNASEQDSGNFESSQIWYLPPNEGEARRITNDLNNYAGVSLTADSRRLVTVQSDTITNLWLVPANETTRSKQVTFGAGKRDGWHGVAWTPDGRIVYVSNASGNDDLWIMNSDGSNPTELTSNSRINNYPSVSLDGRYILFTSNRAGTPNIWRIDIDGSNPKQLTSGSGENYAQCSPDGKWVVYTLLGAGKPTLWRVSIDGGAPQELTKAASSTPAISPDGKLIAYVSWEEQPNSSARITVMQSEGGEPVKVFEIPGSLNGNINWTANGLALTYVITSGGISNLWMQQLSGGQAKQLTDFKESQIFWFDWSRDGKHLVCARGMETDDVVLISNFR